MLIVTQLDSLRCNNCVFFSADVHAQRCELNNLLMFKTAVVDTFYSRFPMDTVLAYSTN